MRREKKKSSMSTRKTPMTPMMMMRKGRRVMGMRELKVNKRVRRRKRVLMVVMM